MACYDVNTLTASGSGELSVNLKTNGGLAAGANGIYLSTALIGTAVGITVSTSYQTISSSLALTAGDWYICSVIHLNSSVASTRTATAQIYDSTNAAMRLDVSTRVENDTADNAGQLVLAGVFTITGTADHVIQLKASATGGSLAWSLKTFSAIKVNG